MNSTRIILALLALAALVPTTAGGASKPNSLVVAKLAPLDGQDERALVVMAAGRQPTISGWSLGASNPTSINLALSRRSCSGVQANLGNPGLIGKGLLAKALTTNEAFQGTTFDDEAVRQVSRRQLRATKSIVLLADGEPRACGKALGYKLTDVLISS